MRKLRLFLICVLMTCLGIDSYEPFAMAHDTSQMILSVKASDDADMETRLTIFNSKIVDDIARGGIRNRAQAIPVTDTYLTVVSRNGSTLFKADRKGRLFNEQTGEMVVPHKSAQKALLQYMNQLRAIHYGRIVEWSKVSRMLPKKSVFTVVDLETGLAFRVQKRAGQHHADVQPLTKRDTAIMKRIYNGKWSWQRKAVLIQTGTETLAASMHGMPHGGDGIPDNGFSGHFCIHFLGSTTHGSRNVDPGHQLMIRKAAGTLDEYLEHASPYEVADAFLIAMHSKESQIAKMCFPHAAHPQIALILTMMNEITGIQKRSETITASNTSNLLALEIPVAVGISRKGRREEKTTFIFHMRRASQLEPWKIDFVDMR